MRFFLMSQGSLNPKIKFLGRKMFFVAHPQPGIRYGHTDTHESEYSGHSPRVSEFFRSVLCDPRTDRQKLETDYPFQGFMRFFLLPMMKGRVQFD